MSEKYGFVYLWRDKKHKRYYVGCHWGRENDGYICSSTWMKNSYKRRPEDFKRKILSRIYTNKLNMLEEEFRYLSMIKTEELRVKYYNLHNRHYKYWWADEDKQTKILEKTGAKISSVLKQTFRKNRETFGSSFTEKHRENISKRTKEGMKKPGAIYVKTSEHIAIIRETNRKYYAQKKMGMCGKTHKEETIKKMSENNAMNNPKFRQKVSDSKKGIRWLVLDSSKEKRMAVPGTEKFELLISQGFRLV